MPVAAYSCVMDLHRTIATLSTRALLTRRRRLAGRLGEVEQVLAGSLVEQTRRCGRPECRCAAGRAARPVPVLLPAPGGSREVAVRTGGPGGGGAGPAGRGEQVQEVLAEISAINLELLARRELD